MHTIRLDGPAKNALGTQMMQWIRNELVSADGRPVLITGTGDAFSAGLNLKELLTLDADGMCAFLMELDALVEALFRYPGPTAAAVNGHAIAGGCIVAMCCDIRVMTTNPRARIGLNEVALGLQFPPRTLETVRYLLPNHTAEEVILGAGLHGPGAALSLGLVHETAEDPQAVATERLAARAKLPPVAYAATKATMRDGVGLADPKNQAAFLEEVLPVWTSPQLKETILAVLGKK